MGVPGVGRRDMERPELPKSQDELMVADEERPPIGFRRQIPKRMKVDRPGYVEFLRRGIRASVGAFRVKRVMGF